MITNSNDKISKHEYLLMVLGLIPFFVSAISLSLGINEFFLIEDLKQMAALYSLVIVSFMAGVVWGIALVRPQRKVSQKKWLGDFLSSRYFYLSNIVAILIWITYFLAPNSQTFFIAALLCFIYLLLIDRRLYYLGAIDKTYFRLRIIVTVAVSACLASIIHNIA